MLSPCGRAACRFELSTLAAIVFVAGCAGAGADTRHRLDDLEQQLVSAHNRNDRLEERVAALEAARDAEQAQQPASAEEQPAADEHGRDLPVVKLGPNVEEPVQSDPQPDALEAEAAGQSLGDKATGGRSDAGRSAPSQLKQGGPNKPGNKSAAPVPDKPREVIKLHGDGSQSRLSAPKPGTPPEVQSTCPV